MVLFMKLFPKQKYLTEYKESKDTNLDTFTYFLSNKTIIIDNQSLYKIEL